MVKEANYVTRAGALRMQAELLDLRTKQRRKVVQDVADAAAQGDRSENAEYIYGKKKLREIDRRIYFLTKLLETSTVVDAARPPTELVFFGATVDLQLEDASVSTYRIVGADEVDLDQGCVSYRSPLGRTLLGRKRGDTITLRKPRGEAELTIVGVRYL